MNRAEYKVWVRQQVINTGYLIRNVKLQLAAFEATQEKFIELLTDKGKFEEEFLKQKGLKCDVN
jgi:hypothetical protein